MNKGKQSARLRGVGVGSGGLGKQDNAGSDEELIAEQNYQSDVDAQQEHSLARP